MKRSAYRPSWFLALAALLIAISGVEGIILPGRHLEEDRHGCVAEPGEAHAHVEILSARHGRPDESAETRLASFELGEQHRHLLCVGCSHIYYFLRPLASCPETRAGAALFTPSARAQRGCEPRPGLLARGPPTVC